MNLYQVPQRDLLQEYFNHKANFSTKFLSKNETWRIYKIVDLVKEGKLNLDMDWQRELVWGDADNSKKNRKSQLIESAFLEIPIPPIFISVIEGQDKTYFEVLDGKQRLSTIIDFINDGFVLKELTQLSCFNGCTFRSLPNRIQNIFLEDVELSVIVLRNTTPKIAEKVFERLNAGGVPLNAMELRNCIYSGGLIDKLRSIVYSKEGLKNHTAEIMEKFLDSKKRLQALEAALIFLALNDDPELKNYSKSHLGVFVDRFLERNRNPEPPALEYFADLIEGCVAASNMIFEDDIFCSPRTKKAPNRERKSRRPSKAVFYTVMIGFVPYYKNKEKLLEAKNDIREAFLDLADKDKDFLYSQSITNPNQIRHNVFTWRAALKNILGY